MSTSSSDNSVTFIDDNGHGNPISLARSQTGGASQLVEQNPVSPNKKNSIKGQPLSLSDEIIWGRLRFADFLPPEKTDAMRATKTNTPSKLTVANATSVADNHWMYSAALDRNVGPF